MKNILILSDIHYSGDILTLINDVIDECSIILFAGDGYYTIRSFLGGNTDKLIAVRGNCDSCYDIHDEKIIELEGLKILLLHGDKYSVKNNLTELKDRAEEVKADIVIYGHTHISEINQINGITYINSGSLKPNFMGHSTYAYLTLTGNKRHYEKIVDIMV